MFPLRALRRASSTASRLTYPAAPPPGRFSGRLMDATIWPRISSIWPSGSYFEHETETLHEEDDVHEVVIEDARRLAVPPVLDTHGFELLHAPTLTTDFDAPDLSSYVEETAQLVRAATGAELVVPFHNVKMDTGRDKFGKRGGAVERVHGDYTPPIM